MDDPGHIIAGGVKPVAYLVLGYCMETAQNAGTTSYVWANSKDMEATLKNYVGTRALPFSVSAGHVRAALLMLEGGYISIERDSREKGRNLEHAFKVRVNPSGRAYFEKLTEEIGYEVKHITGP